MQLYLIPGVAADHRIFQKLDLSGYPVKVLELPEMVHGSTIADYAQKLAANIDRSASHVLIGMSMGGMIAQELASLSKPERVIIVSSWKGPEEMPLWIEKLRGTHPERIVSGKFIDRILPMLHWQMGAENDEDRSLIDLFAHTMPVEQIKAQLHASLNWNGTDKLINKLIHIHGDNDHLMPIGSIKDAIPVKDGGHFMVYNKAKEISALIASHLASIER